MKLHEAIEALLLPENNELWIRPVGWKGKKDAFFLHDDKRALKVLDGRGGSFWMTYNVATLTGDWEIVSPDTVLDGE